MALWWYVSFLSELQSWFGPGGLLPLRLAQETRANANNWACAAAQQSHHGTLLDAGVRIVEHPAMLHAKAFVQDGDTVLAGTCNLEAWSLKRFFEIDLRVRSRDLADQFEHRFAAPAELWSDLESRFPELLRAG